jgi:biopolymer transport protein ExbD
VTTTAMAEAEHTEGGFEVSLPKAGKSASVVPVEDLAVAVLADGRLVVRGKEVTEAQLEQVMAETQAKAPGTMVLVQADAGVAHGRVVAVMDLARKKGLERLAIATQQAGP